MPKETAHPTAPKRRFWKWMKRVLLGFFVLLLLIAIFHQPLLRWSLQTVAPKLASKANYELDWKVEGDLWNELGFSEVTVKGPEGSPLRSLTIDNFDAIYSLPKLYREGLGEFLASVTLEGASVELDLTIPKSETKKKEKAEKIKKEGFPDFWVGGLDLRNINLRLITNTGVIEVKNFTFILKEGQVGEISFDKILVPQAKIEYGQANGETYLEDRTITLKALHLDERLHLDHLIIALSDFTTEVVGYDVKLTHTGATVQLSGKATHLKTSPVVDLELQIANFTEKSLLPWVQLPSYLIWTVDDLKLNVKGSVLEPQKLQLALSVDFSKILVKDFHIASGSLEANLSEGGLFQVNSLKAQTGSNQVDLRASTQLPSRWQDLKWVDAKADYRISAPQVSEFWIVNPLLHVSAEAQGELVLVKNQLIDGKQEIHLRDFMMKDLHVKSLDSTLTLAPKKIVVQSLDVGVDEHNRLRFAGEYHLPAQQRVTGTLDGQLANVRSLLARLGVTLPNALHNAQAETSLKLDLNLNELPKQNFLGSSAEGEVKLASVESPHAEIPEARFLVKLEEGRVILRDIKARINQSDQLEGAIELGLAGLRSFHTNLHLKVDDASTLTRFIPNNSDLPAKGNLELNAVINGNLEEIKTKEFKQLSGHIHLISGGLEWGKATLERAEISVQVEKSIAQLEVFNIALDDHQGVNANGWFKLDESMEFDATLGVQLPKLTSLNPWLENLNQPSIESGSLKLAWSGAGQAKSKDILGNASVELKDFKTKSIPKPLALSLTTKHDFKQAQIAPLHFHFGSFHLQLDAEASEEWLKVSTLTLASGQKKWLEGRVEIPLELKQSKDNTSSEKPLPIHPDKEILINLHSEKLALHVIFQSLGMKPPVEGQVTLDIDLHGKLKELAGKAKVELFQIQSAATKGKLSPADAKFAASVTPEKIQADFEILQKPLQPLVASFEVPARLEEIIRQPKVIETLPIKANVELPKSQLGFVKNFSPLVKSLDGTVEIDLDVGGSLKQPNWQGAIVTEVTNASFTQKNLPEIKGLNGKITFKDHTINIERVATTLAGGQIAIQGQIDAKELKNPSINVSLSAKEALLVRDETMSMRANAELLCRGTLEQASVTGNVDLVRGRVFKEIEFLPLSLPNQLPPPPPSVTLSKATAPAAPPPFDKWQFNIAIRTRDQIRLLGNVLNGGVAVDLKAHGTGAQPVLEGEVNLVGARLRLPFSRLAFSRGRVIFSPDKFLQPELDIQGDSVVGQYEVTVYATGSAFNPQLRMTSSPPLSEGDIATLLATGSTSGDLKSSEGMAANRAAYLLISQTYRKLFRKAQPMRYDEEPPKLSFNFSLLNTGNSQRSVSAIYEISPKLQAVGTVGEKGTFRGLLYYLVRFR